MDTKLIIDSGATKTRWVLLTKGKPQLDITGSGFNPYYLNSNEEHNSFADFVPQALRQTKPEKIYFYGAGCSTDENCKLVQTLYKTIFPFAEIKVAHDLMGSAIALFGQNSGIACILGTGSNSCVWDGSNITDNVPSLGWILGDQGSGTYLGKLILAQILSGQADKQLKQAFYRYANMDFKKVLQTVYRSDHPNRWIASVSKFAALHRNNNSIKKLIKKNFNDFFYEQINRYDRPEKQNIGFTGSIAFHFQDELKEVLHEKGLYVYKIMQNPMEGLIAYHQNH